MLVRLASRGKGKVWRRLTLLIQRPEKCLCKALCTFQPLSPTSLTQTHIKELLIGSFSTFCALGVPG